MANIFTEVINHHSLKTALKIGLVFYFCRLWVAFYSFLLHFNLISKVASSWVIGPSDVAGYANRISKYIENAKTIIFIDNKFSGTSKNFGYGGTNYVTKTYFELLSRPRIIGKQIALGSSFVYLGFNSYIFDCYCVRKAEFSLIKGSKGKIVCIFLGSEIRSPMLSDELSKAIGQDLLTTYLFEDARGRILKTEMELRAKSLASSADEFANLVLNSPMDQISYLKSKTQPIFYFLPSDQNEDSQLKSRFKTGRVKVVHAPTSKLIKGTALVRSVVKKLQLEGWDFEYVELFDAQPEQIFHNLEDADIVLNEFYSFLPGMFGIEAMYFKCALLTSADRDIEKWLPSGAENAWLRTRYWEIEENLKILLKDHDKINQYSINGYKWAVENYNDHANATVFSSIFREI